MNSTPRRAAAVLALSVALAGSAFCVRTLWSDSGGLDASGGRAEAALWCVGIPAVYLDNRPVYPGGEACVPGP